MKNHKEPARILIPIVEAPSRECQLGNGDCDPPKYLLDVPGCPGLLFCCPSCAEAERSLKGAEVESQLRAA